MRQKYALPRLYEERSSAQAVLLATQGEKIIPGESHVQFNIALRQQITAPRIIDEIYS